MVWKVTLSVGDMGGIMLHRRFARRVRKLGRATCGRWLGLVSLLPLLTFGGAATLSASGTPNCSITASGPVLYAGMVFPDILVRCDSEVNRIRIEGVLEMDGVQVGTARRDCRKTDQCRLSVDLRTSDKPDDQTWCGHASATVSGKDSVGRASSCETF